MEFPATLVQILKQAEVQDQGSQVSVTAQEKVETSPGTSLSPRHDLAGRPVDVRVKSF